MNKILYSLLTQYVSLIQKKYHTIYVMGLGKTGTLHLATVGC